jgi:hypothetical protein
MSEKIISFEEYRVKKLGRKQEESPLNELFKKDLREQKDLLDWYWFHNQFNKHKLFVHALFLENHVPGRTNPNCGYIVCYHQDQFDTNTQEVVKAVEWEGRTPVLINAADKTYKQIGELITGSPQQSNYKSSQKIKETLLQSDEVYVFQGISKMKGTTPDKIGHVRSFIKTLDDAHFKDIQPKADLIFVDYASFLQEAWESIGIYLNILS